MHPVRATGRVRPPTVAQVLDYAARHHLHLGPDRAEFLTAVVGETIAASSRLDDLDEPSVPLQFTNRDPGRPPRAGEDPYNAFIRYCRVEGAAEGPLAGRTLAVKDCISVAGIPTTNGGRRIPPLVPIEDAVVVERLLAAGCTIVGKTNLEDLALGLGEGSYFGAARNPHDPRFATGGSSSGSGAAVAAGLADLALGADEAGSVRIPAAWCGLVGMKATHGLVPSYGLSYMDHTLDHIGPMTRTVADNAAMLQVMAGSDWRDPQWVRGDIVVGDYVGAAGEGVEGLRIGVLTESLAPVGVTPDVAEVFERAQKTFTSLGATISEVSVPLWPDAFAIEGMALGVGLTMMAHSYGQGYGHMGRIDPYALSANAAQTTLQADDLPAYLQASMIAADYLHDKYLNHYYGKAHNLRLELRRQIDALFEDVDLIITPTTPTVAHELLDRPADDAEMLQRMMESIGAVSNTCALDLSGHPGLSVPAGTGAHDLPVGVQIIGPRFADALVYQAGFAFEAA
ncbi:MAG TPA: amidase family protein [Acidimicrobiia bacterium]|jgi:amidase